jgi:hypothetical protein
MKGWGIALMMCCLLVLILLVLRSTGRIVFQR